MLYTVVNQTMQDFPTEQMADASPSALDAYNGDVKTAIKVLEEEAKAADSEWMTEELEAVAEYFQTEVL
ncbi:hypothetical protein OSG_eHP23_00120 [environmental Halophage eHP-23]|nr:hypothetical protein OSG_eHP23_00120 [environmental Halophage eHP-23]AFH22787.1 hypothetical protein OSG_eHP35_00015 [environmental Halophage eHP-35]